MFGTSDVSSSDAAAVASPDSQLKELISAVNKLRPKFLVMIGNFTHSVSAPTTTATATATTATTGASGDIYNQQVEAFRKTMARLSDTIPAVYCPGSHDVGTIPTPATLHAYRQRFGADYFGFWYGGMRGLVINSSLLINPSGAPEEAARQEIWLTEEIEQSKLCSNNMIVFSYHPWFVSDMEEADSDVTVAPGVGADGSGNAISGDVIR